MRGSGGKETDLNRLADLAAEFEAENLARTARLIAGRASEGRFYVACVGQFKRGKSTLLNALVGQAILPTGVLPVTSFPTILRHGPALTSRLRLAVSGWKDIPANEIEDYISENKNPGNLKGIEALEVFVPCPMLATGMCLVDTPGLGSVFTGNTKATRDFIPQMDAALFVLGADPPISGEEIALAENVAGQTREILFVLNKADRVSEEDLSASAAFARQVLETRLGRAIPKIFEVSALERLEHRGPERDWEELVQSLDQLVQRSGRELVRDAFDRAIGRAAANLLAVIGENRRALQRPLEESESRIRELRLTVERAGASLQDLDALFGAEQQRVSRAIAGRRKLFLDKARDLARDELRKGFPLLQHRRNGPAYRREVMHQAQEIARATLVPWLEAEECATRESFRNAMRRFAEMANDFLRCLSTMESLDAAEDPSELDSERSLQSKSQFQFHLIERVAAPASPLLFVADLICGVLGLRDRIRRQAEEFLEQLLEVNSARVRSEFDERVRESRRSLETAIRTLLQEARGTAERALALASAAQSSGATVVQGSLAHLDEIEREIQSIAGPRCGLGVQSAYTAEPESNG
jgi:antitoxin component HigA of HigAB toxin-antitoxin module/GTP-binding protein EngB required for normal cell division